MFSKLLSIEFKIYTTIKQGTKEIKKAYFTNKLNSWFLNLPNSNNILGNKLQCHKQF